MSKWQIFGWTTPFSVKKCAQSFTDLAPFALRPAPVRDQSPRRLLASCHTQRAARSALARSPGRSFDSSWRIRPSAAITPPHKSIRTLSCRVPLLRLTAQLHHSTGAPPCTKTAADLEVPFAFKFPTRIFVFFTSKKFNFLSVWIESYCFFIYIYIFAFLFPSVWFQNHVFLPMQFFQFLRRYRNVSLSLSLLHENLKPVVCYKPAFCYFLFISLKQNCFKTSLSLRFVLSLHSFISDHVCYTM